MRFQTSEVLQPKRGSQRSTWRRPLLARTSRSKGVSLARADDSAARIPRQFKIRTGRGPFFMACSRVRRVRSFRTGVLLWSLVQ